MTALSIEFEAVTTLSIEFEAVTTLSIDFQCHFVSGNGWVKGSYRCICRDGFYGNRESSQFNGTYVEGKKRSELNGAKKLSS